MNIEIIVNSVLLIISVVLCLHFLRIYKLAAASFGWPTTRGKIKSFKISSHSGSGKSDRTWYCKIRYTYIVNAIEYSGSRISYRYVFINADYPLEYLVKLENKYKEQQEVDVYYDETNPIVSVLEPGGRNSIVPYMIGSAIVLLFSLVGFGNWFLNE